MPESYQINNLKITFSQTYKKWQVKAPGNRILEEFRLLDRAKAFAEKTYDFVVRGQPGSTRKTMRKR